MLTFAGFAIVNRERCEESTGFNHLLDQWSLSDWMIAAVGELGGACNKVKKLNRYRDGIVGNTETEQELREGVKDEIADAIIYLDLVAQSMGTNLEDIIVSKFNRTSEKIGAPHRLSNW